MTSSQLEQAFRLYIDTVLSNQVANLDSVQIREVIAGLAENPAYVSPYPLRDGQAAEMLECIEAVLNPPEEQPVPRHIAPYDFQAMFTDSELVAIQTSLDPIVIRARTKLQTIITHVDLDSEETQQLIGYLQIIGILTAERAAEILS